MRFTVCHFTNAPAYFSTNQCYLTVFIVSSTLHILYRKWYILNIDCRKKKSLCLRFFFLSLSLSLHLLAAACTIDQFEIAAPQLCSVYVLKSKHPICERFCLTSQLTWPLLTFELWHFLLLFIGFSRLFFRRTESLNSSVCSLNSEMPGDAILQQKLSCFESCLSQTVCCNRRTGILVWEKMYYFTAN